MAAVITACMQSSPGQVVSPTSFQQGHSFGPPDMHASRRQSSQRFGPAPISPSGPAAVLAVSRGSGRAGTSCDACIRRRSRCAMNELVNKCYSCEFHRQECTFTLSTVLNPPAVAADMPSRKRKLEETVSTVSEDVAPIERTLSTTSSELQMDISSVQSRDKGQGRWVQTSHHIGMTTELEPVLLEHLPLDSNGEGVLPTARVRKCGNDGTFMRLTDIRPNVESQPNSVDAVESLVAPYGSTLVDKYFEHIHPFFPVLVESDFRRSYRTRKNISPLLLSAVYILALKFLEVGSNPRTMRRPDKNRLESTALKLLSDSLQHATMSTVQAGILIMQRSSLNTAALNAQLVTAGFELGLHQDCSNWKMEPWEQGLRKRLAWALYMQDKWCSLVHGRPSHIFASNWTVRDLVEQDFVDASCSASQDEDSPVSHGSLLFCHMIALTSILSDILDRFYTLQATNEFQKAGDQRTRLILDKAKPAQIRLKEWFATLPSQLKMEPSTDMVGTASVESANNGALHLSYFATEITLHRCIVRSLTPETADSYLSHICRSAAKTRLISAMEFVNRLRPIHLRSFWPAASRTNFALIGSFGVLLRITAPTKEEAEFYRLRLFEYRWTLSVSLKHAEFLDFALESLDNATTLDRHVPEKPAIDELMTSAAKPVTRLPRLASTMRLNDESMLDAESALDSGRRGTSTAVSGLASPATSMSDDDMHDDKIPAV